MADMTEPDWTVDCEPCVMGVDPGGRNTAIVLRRVDTGSLEHAHLLQRDDEPLEEWCRMVAKATVEAARMRPLVAAGVEGTKPPNPHLGMTNPKGIIETAWVAGSVLTVLLSTATDVEIVPPGGHGSGPRGAYPDTLWGEREKAGKGKLKDVRSAWDIAGVVRLSTRMEVT